MKCCVKIISITWHVYSFTLDWPKLVTKKIEALAGFSTQFND